MGAVMLAFSGAVMLYTSSDHVTFTTQTERVYNITHLRCGVLVCATNLTAMLDPAALRCFDLRLDMPVADEQTAIAIIQSRLVELAMSVDDIAAMAACAAGLAPALIVQAVDTAARRTLLESDITMIDGGLLTGLMEQARVDTGEERRASDA